MILDSHWMMKTMDIQTHWIEDWLSARAESEHTRANYTWCYGEWVKFVRARFNKDASVMVSEWRVTKRLDENAREGWIEEWQDIIRSFNTWMKPKFAPLTCKNFLSTLKSFCRFWQIPLLVELPRRPYVIYHNRDLTREEVKQLINFASARDRVIYLMLAESGLRIGTLIRLKYWMIKEDFLKNRVPMRIVLPSSELKDRVGDRWTFIGSEGAQQLKDYLSRRTMKDDDFIFSSERQGKVTGDQFTGASISVKFNRLVQKLGIDVSVTGKLKPGERPKPKKIRLHGLRKFFRNNMHCESSFIEFWMGHSLGVDDHYITRDIEVHRTEYAKGYKSLRLGTIDVSETVEVLEELRSARESDAKRISELTDALTKQTVSLSDAERRLQVLTNLVSALSPRTKEQVEIDGKLVDVGIQPRDVQSFIDVQNLKEEVAKIMFKLAEYEKKKV